MRKEREEREEMCGKTIVKCEPYGMNIGSLKGSLEQRLWESWVKTMQ